MGGVVLRQLLGVLGRRGLGLLLIDLVLRRVRAGMLLLLRRRRRRRCLMVLVNNARGSRVLLKMVRCLTLLRMVGMMLHRGDNH